jgi:hypothetical protein
MPARLTPKWRVIVRIKMGAVGILALPKLIPKASIARHAIDACGRFRGAAACASRDGAWATYDSSSEDQLKTPVNWARWTVRQQLTLRRHQARPKPRLGFLCVVSGRARARNALWYWSTPSPRKVRNSVGIR